jgi:hypothetical protein
MSSISIEYKRCTDNLDTVNLEIIKISNNVENIKKNYNEKKVEHEYEINKNNEQYERLFSYIKSLEDDCDNNDLYWENSVLNQIIQIKKTKKYSEKYELQLYRIEKELNKNKNDCILLIGNRNKLEEEQKQLEDYDIRTMCEICCFKKDKFLSCWSCTKILCSDCFDNILNKMDNNIIDNFVKCPYCRNVNCLYNII